MKPKFPPTIVIQDEDFGNAWARAVRYVVREGHKLTIGNAEEPKPIRDICAIIELTGNAIKQIENKELHPQFPFRHVDPYCEEFTREFHSKYMNLDDDVSKFSYVYIDRLVNHPSRLPTQANIDQMVTMRDSLKDEIDEDMSSNRNQCITWIPYSDIGHTSSPCLQRVWVRHIRDKNVEVHLSWRSRDLYTAWQVNIIAVIDMLNREVIRPNDCEIVKVVDYSNSLHIYDGDFDAAMVVERVPTFRM